MGLDFKIKEKIKPQIFFKDSWLYGKIKASQEAITLLLCTPRKAHRVRLPQSEWVGV
jgi:hypothetical protein